MMTEGASYWVNLLVKIENQKGVQTKRMQSEIKESMMKKKMMIEQVTVDDADD
jgi:spore germination protein GerM